MQWWNIYVQVPERVSESVSAYLQHLGSAGVVIYDMMALSPGEGEGLNTCTYAAGWSVLYGALPVDAALPVRLCALQQFLDICPKRLTGPRWKMYCHLLQDPEYLTQWRRFFRPFCVAQRLVICPPWDTTPVSLPMESLKLDPGLAFGTGLHPTTRLCLTLLAQSVTPDRGGRLLDLGCGSGILGLAALKLGADTVVGVDVDPQAVMVAKRNAALNGLQDRVQFLEGSLDRVTGQFAWIVANIYLGPLVDMMPALARHLMSQGRVILSGILEPQELALQTSLRAAGLRVERRLVDEGWVALEGRPVSSAREQSLQA
jgi:ribosomal protein L11 methyltransferase